jgi:hypothetical protein
MCVNLCIYFQQEETISQQQLAADTLAALQTFEMGEHAPVLLVSFAFPTVFQQALSCVPQLN